MILPYYLARAEYISVISQAFFFTTVCQLPATTDYFCKHVLLVQCPSKAGLCPRRAVILGTPLLLSIFVHSDLSDHICATTLFLSQPMRHEEVTTRLPFQQEGGMFM